MAKRLRVEEMHENDDSLANALDDPEPWQELIYEPIDQSVAVHFNGALTNRLLQLVRQPKNWSVIHFNTASRSETIMQSRRRVWQNITDQLNQEVPSPGFTVSQVMARFRHVKGQVKEKAVNRKKSVCSSY